MDNLLEGGIAQLEEVKTALSELPGKEQNYKDSERSLKAKQKELEIQRKRVEEKINSSIKKSRTELERGFDEQLGIAEKAIKDAETRKKNAKSAAINLRMKRENSYLVDENKVLGAEIKSLFRGENVPAFCKSNLYYALFKPKKMTDYLICIAGILICAGLIPFLITRFVSKPFWQVVVWIFIVLFFAAVYFLIAYWTKKGERDVVLTKARPSIDRIAANKKLIKKTNRNIKADPDESQYNLSEYDQEVEMAKSEYDTILAEKDAAIQNFENVESVSIREQMQEEKASAFQELEKEIDQMQEDLRLRTEIYQDAARDIETYSGMLGEKNMKADRIDELISIISDARAASVQEALEVQKTKKQKVWQQTEPTEEVTPEEDNSIEDMATEAADTQSTVTIDMPVDQDVPTDPSTKPEESDLPDSAETTAEDAEGLFEDVEEDLRQ